MNRRDFLRTSALSAAAFAVSRRWVLPSTQRPNFVLIVIDDLGWNNVGFMGSRFYETPNLDRLAKDSVVFTNAYANAPNCAPTRASLLTGQYTPRHGIYTVGNSARGPSRLRKLIPIPNRTVLPSWEVTIAEALKPAGYVSASIGKWHLGRDPESGPVSQGFDLNVGGYEKGHPVRYFSPYRNPFLKDGPKGEYLTDRLTTEAISFIRKNRDRPFFLYFPTYAVHTPLQAPDDVVAKYRKKPRFHGQANPVHGAMVEIVDRNVGRLMAALDELGLAEKTV
ncbi:MAG TPA: twin-arginine translocation signal domain-containing protein, partial [Bacteroidetes bacterium]|nr:twin-arginine translocation signal domain-containing protein [Bacteroidota bacterium]